MCYGFNGERALTQSLREHAPDRRTVLRGALAGLLGAGAVGSAVSPAVAGQRRARGSGHHRQPSTRSVPAGLISMQLWTMRAALSGTPGYDATLSAMAEMGYQRVEQALGYFGRTATELKAFYNSIGIRASSSHDGISPTMDAARTKFENAATLGQNYIVVPYLNSSVLADWQQWADQMNAEAALARRYGLKYGYHNHAHEFTIDLGGGVTPWQVLTSHLDPSLVHLEVDLYWAYTGGVNTGAPDPDQFVIDTIAAAPQRTLQFHVKDRDPATGDMADLGTGVVDFQRIFAAHRVREYIVENDTPDVTPLNTAQVGYQYLRDVRF